MDLGNGSCRPTSRCLGGWPWTPRNSREDDLQSLNRRSYHIPSHREDAKGQDTTGQDFCVWLSGVYKSTHRSEDHHTGHAVASLLEQPRLQQQADVDVIQVGARLAGFAPQWRSLLGSCWSTNTVEEGVGLNFQHWPQLTHHSIAFRTRNSRKDLQQAVDALLSKGAIERVLNRTSLGFYSRVFLVPKKTGDLHPVIDLSALDHHMVVPHLKMETQASVRAAIRRQEWTVSIDIRDA